MATALVARGTRREPRRRRQGSARPAVYVVLVLAALVIVVPLVWILLTSFKTDYDAINMMPWEEVVKILTTENSELTT